MRLSEIQLLLQVLMYTHNDVDLNGRKENYVNNEEQHTGDTMEAAVPLDAVNESSIEQNKQVPLVALESERNKRQHLEEENRMMREHFALLQAQQRQSATPQQDELSNLDDSDVMTIGEFKKISSKITNDFQMTIQELKMTQKYPDYQDVVTRYLPEVLKTNPNLRDALSKSQDYDLAYYLAKNSDSYKSDNRKVKKNEDAERIIKNSQSTGSLSSFGSSTPVTQAKRYKDMSDAEFREVVNKNRAY